MASKDDQSKDSLEASVHCIEKADQKLVGRETEMVGDETDSGQTG